MDCNSLLTGVRPLQLGDIKDFVTIKGIQLKTISFEGGIKAGSGDNLSGLVINTDEYKTIFPNQTVVESYKQKLTAFMSRLDKDLKNYDDNIFIFTSKSQNTQTITYFHFQEGRVIGYVHPYVATATQQLNPSILNRELEYAFTKKKTVIWVGDNIDFDIGKVAADSKTVIYRRPDFIDKALPTSLESLDKVFTPEKSSICNAIPSTEYQVMKGGFSKSAVKEWKAFKGEVAAHTINKFQSEISSISALKDEFIKGDGDFLLIAAHLKGDELFIGDEMVTLKNVKEWGKRLERVGKNRTAFLLICNAGNQEYRVGSVFWKTKVEPLANILLDNNYFDAVVAPDHTISRAETTAVLKKLIGNRSLLEIQKIFKGWVPYVFRLRTVKPKQIEG